LLWQKVDFFSHRLLDLYSKWKVTSKSENGMKHLSQVGKYHKK